MPQDRFAFDVIDGPLPPRLFPRPAAPPATPPRPAADESPSLDHDESRRDNPRR